MSTDYFTDSDVIIGVNVFRRGEKHFNPTCFFAIGAKNVIFRQKRVIVHLCTSCELIEINIYIYTREYELDKLSNDLSCFRNADEAHSITILERCFNGGIRQKA